MHMKGTQNSSQPFAGHTSQWAGRSTLILEDCETPSSLYDLEFSHEKFRVNFERFSLLCFKKFQKFKKSSL